MNKRKYRLFVICCLVLDLLVMLISGYRYLDRKIPDEIQISRGKKTEDVTEVLSTPFVTFEEAVTVSQDGGYILPCKLLGYIPFKEIKVTPADDQEIYVSGSTIGIYMQTEGVLVIDTGEIQNRNGETEEPARNIIRQGDYIISFNGEKISTKRELIDDISELDGSEVTLGISRKGESIPVSVTPVKDKKGDYKLGIWVRDDTQGIGTLTYVDQNPGELAGYICYDDRNILGTIEANSRNGIYGQFRGIADDAITLKKMPAAYKQEVKIGTATILCSTDGKVKEYDAEIRKIDLNHEDTNKSFVIKVTDKELLEATGGIVQGLSGSPVIQNGKIIGAVTHVFVQDASSGYGIFIENMLKNTERLF